MHADDLMRDRQTKKYTVELDVDFPSVFEEIEANSEKEAIEKVVEDMVFYLNTTDFDEDSFGMLDGASATEEPKA